MTAVYVILPGICAIAGYLLLIGEPFCRVYRWGLDYFDRFFAKRRETKPEPKREFECKAQVEGQSIAVYMRGVINSKMPRTDISIEVKLIDVTEPDGDTRAVRCEDQRYRSERTGEFQYSGPGGTLPQARTEMKEWIQAACIKADSLIMARAGTRRLEVELCVKNAATRIRIAMAQGQMLFESERPGYIDLAYRADKARRFGVSMAIHLAVSNGQVHDEQIEMIREWYLRDNKFGCDKEITKGLFKAVDYWRTAGEAAVENLCNTITDLADKQTTLDICSLCLDIAGGGDCGEETIGQANYFAWRLKADHNLYLSMLEKHILKAGKAEFVNPEFMLGLFPGVSGEAACALLNDEYRRWNARVTSFDPAIRARAGKMIELITRVRPNYQPESVVA